MILCGFDFCPGFLRWSQWLRCGTSPPRATRPCFRRSSPTTSLTWGWTPCTSGATCFLSSCLQPDVRFYINWTRLVFTCMLPVIFLILLNYKIFRGIRFSKMLLRSIFIMRWHFFCILRVLEVFEDFHHDMVVFFNSEHERASSAIILLPSALCFHFPRRWYVEKLRRYVKKLLQNILFFSSWKDIAAQRNPKHLGRKKSSNI